MEPLRIFLEAPDTGLAWLFYALLGVFIVVILVGSLTERGENAAPGGGYETRKSPRKSDKSAAIKRIKR